MVSREHCLTPSLDRSVSTFRGDPSASLWLGRGRDSVSGLKREDEGNDAQGNGATRAAGGDEGEVRAEALWSRRVQQTRIPVDADPVRVTEFSPFEPRVERCAPSQPMDLVAARILHGEGAVPRAREADGSMTRAVGELLDHGGRTRGRVDEHKALRIDARMCISSQSPEGVTSARRGPFVRGIFTSR